MRLLTVPSWSFGRDRRLLVDCRDLVVELGLTFHYAESDVDLNRTVMAFSGPSETVGMGLEQLAQMILPGIDLGRHAGAHPRIGALDVCPFVALDPPKTKLRSQRLREWIEDFAQSFSAQFEVPVFLYERSERDRSEAELSQLRKGGFGGLLDRTLRPDFGPAVAHPHLGVAVMGWRDFLLATNVNLATPDANVAKRIAQRIRDLRANGDERMLGVRALGLPLASRDMSQLALNFTMPDVTPVDAVLDYVERSADSLGAEVAYHELVGVIRDKDLAGATKLHPRTEQIVHIGVKV